MNDIQAAREAYYDIIIEYVIWAGGKFSLSHDITKFHTIIRTIGSYKGKKRKV